MTNKGVRKLGDDSRVVGGAAVQAGALLPFLDKRPKQPGPRLVI
jgi:hypothetical protein